MARGPKRARRQPADSESSENTEPENKELETVEEKADREEYEKRLKNLNGLLAIDDCHEALRLARAIETKWEHRIVNCPKIKRLKKSATDGIKAGRKPVDQSGILRKVLQNGCTQKERESWKKAMKKFRDYYLDGESYTYILFDGAISNHKPPHQLGLFVNHILYIGKGADKRPLDHLREAIRVPTSDLPIQSTKIRKLRQIFDDGGKVGIMVTNRETDDAAAFGFEHAMIHVLGLRSLTNKTRGALSKKTNAEYKSNPYCKLPEVERVGMALLFKALPRKIELFTKTDIENGRGLEEDPEDGRSDSDDSIPPQPPTSTRRTRGTATNKEDKKKRKAIKDQRARQSPSLSPVPKPPPPRKFRR